MLKDLQTNTRGVALPQLLPDAISSMKSCSGCSAEGYGSVFNVMSSDSGIMQLAHFMVLVYILFTQCSMSTPLQQSPGGDPWLSQLIRRENITTEPPPAIDKSQIRCYSRHRGGQPIDSNSCIPLMNYIINDENYKMTHVGTQVYQAPDCPCVATLSGPDERTEIKIKSVLFIIMIRDILKYCDVSRFSVLLGNTDIQ